MAGDGASHYSFGNCFSSEVPLLNLGSPTAGYVRALNLMAMGQLASIDLPEFLSEQSNCISCGSGDGRRYPIKSFADPPEREKGYVVCGAFFVAVLVITI